MDYVRGRLDGFLSGLTRLKVDGFLVTDLSNIRYLSGFTGSSGYILITGKAAKNRWFLTDSRYRLQAASEVTGKALSARRHRQGGFRVKVYKRALPDLTELVKKSGVKRLGFESRTLSYDTFTSLKGFLPGVRLKPSIGLVEGLRAVKDPDELSSLKEAVSVASVGFRAVERRGLRGRTEKDAADLIEASFKKAGADGLSFAPIVASGSRGALPHAKPTDKLIKKGELVVVDAGITLGGYCSDRTRTYVTGRPTRLQKKLYSTVKAAHDRAIEMIRPGLKAGEVDRAARGVISKAGFGRYFSHGTGHGVGLDIHEAPSIGPRSEETIVRGMVFTVEPGVYLPGVGGVRLEDMVVVTGDGCEVLGTPAGELLELG